MDFQKATNRIYNKGDIILHKGTVCSNGYYVVSGCLKSYVIDRTGKEHVLQFAPENWFVSDVESFMTGNPAATFIAAIEQTEVQIFSKLMFGNRDLLSKDELILQNHKLIRNISATNKRLASILTASGEERYLDFIDTYPSLVQRLPLKLIASYIGITPEYLSDIRRKLANR